MLRNTLLINVFLLLGLTAFSQITYTYSDFGVAGETFKSKIKFYVPSDSLLLQQYDTNWDFSQLETDSIETYNYVLPSETEYASSFPNSNLCLLQEDNSIAFLNSSETGVLLKGIVADYAEMGTPLIYNIDEDFMVAQFPLNYGDQFTNSTSFTYTDTPDNMGINSDSLGLPSGVDSIRVNITLTDQSNINAYGTVTLPDGDYDALCEDRNEIFDVGIEILMFSFWIPVPDFGFADTTHIYRWYAKDIGIPLAEVTANPKDQILSIDYYFNEDNFVNETKLSLNSISLYPNPVSEILNIETKNNINKLRYVIIDSQGKQVKESVFNSDINQIDISKLKQGIYFITFFNKEFNEISSKIFQVIR